MTIACVAALHRRQRDQPFLIVCPSSLVTNWAHEFDKWIGKASQPKRVVVRKGGEEGLQAMRSFCSSSSRTGQVLIVSYDLLRLNASLFEKSAQAALLVVDEGHKLKNQKGSLTMTALQSIQADARLLLTATPIQNNLTEFYALAQFCCPGILGTLADFRRDFERPIAAANRKGAPPAIRQQGRQQSMALAAITDKFVLRRLQKDILKTMLPPRTEVLLFCQPSVEQARMYRSIAHNTAKDALSTLTQLRKVCSYPAKAVNKSNPADSFLSGKLQVLQTLLQSIRQKCPEDKVVIVSNFTSTLSLIEEAVLKPHQHSFVRLDGTVECQNRQSLVDQFNRVSAGRTFCFLLSSKAGGCGLNLVGANRLVLFDPDWNPACDIQVRGRIKIL